MGCNHLATSIPDIWSTWARFLELNTKEHDYNFNTYIAVISFIPEYGSQQLHTWYGQPYLACPCTCKNESFWKRISIKYNFWHLFCWSVLLASWWNEQISRSSQWTDANSTCFACKIDWDGLERSRKVPGFSTSCAKGSFCSSFGTAVRGLPPVMQMSLFCITCCLPFSCRPKCALVWGMVVRGFARRDLC